VRPNSAKNPLDGIEDIIDRALTEDLGSFGDVTTLSIVDVKQTGEATFLAKGTGRIAGLPVAERVFKKIDSTLICSFQVEDGHRVSPGTVFGSVRGSLRGILTGERTALNFLQRLSGIATLTEEFVRRVHGTGVRICDTRKTTPGFRQLEKYAVGLGGGWNHRFGLYDMVLVKSNHIDVAGGIRPALILCLRYLAEKSLDLRIEVETRTLDEVREALNHPIHRILLDNMDASDIQEAVHLAKGRIELEASGNVSLENVRTVAETGVNFISVGRLTHSAPALDLSLRLRTVNTSGKGGS